MHPEPPRIARRVLGRAALGLALAAPSFPAAAAARGEWDAFRHRFLTWDGRVVDNGQGGISHSEGQAWGMFLAARHGDRESFDLIRRWTRRHLARQRDALLAWRFEPSPRGGAVTDSNNATDADLYHGWALREAHRQWPGQGFDREARAVARDILGILARRVAGHLLLLPGAWGFETRGALEINPSYLVFEAYAALHEALPDPRWAQLAAGAEHLLRACRFGPLGLPSDWARLDTTTGVVSPASPRPHRFGHDALRVPLNLLWSGRDSHVVLGGILRLWSVVPGLPPPAWVDLARNQPAPFAGGPGTRAVQRLLLGTAGRGANQPEPGTSPTEGYYDAALSLLVAQATAGREAAQRPRFSARG